MKISFDAEVEPGGIELEEYAQFCRLVVGDVDRTKRWFWWCSGGTGEGQLVRATRFRARGSASDRRSPTLAARCKP